MTDFRALARQAAQKHGLDPHIFERQINAESGFNPNAGSGAGAVGIAQFMPATARGLGINPRDPHQALDAAAGLMARYVKQYGSYEKALRAYNAGPGAIEKSRGYGETNAYVAKILGGHEPSAAAAHANPQAVSPSTSGGGSGLSRQVLDTEALKQAQGKQLLAGMLAKQHRGGALLSTGVLSPKPVEPSEFLKTVRSTVRPSSPSAIAPLQNGKSGGSGAAAALGWAKSTLGTAETAGANRGARVDQWEQRFGLKGQPWCAVFTSIAATKGGMPKTGRTPSVAAVRAQAQAGSAAYHRGFVQPQKARAGDLILFGNDHIGMVESVGAKGITMIAGNDSDRVQRRTVAFGSGDIVRPKYR